MARRRFRYVSEMTGSSTMPPDCIPIGTREREPLSDIPIHVPSSRSVFRYVPCMDESANAGAFPPVTPRVQCLTLVGHTIPPMTKHSDLRTFHRFRRVCLSLSPVLGLEEYPP